MHISKIETIHVNEFSNILFVQIHTNNGLIGLGETYYTQRLLHSFMMLMQPGSNPLDIEGHWRRLYDSTHVYGNRGTGLRAISAIDVALWDLFGQHSGLPLYRALGGQSKINPHI